MLDLDQFTDLDEFTSLMAEKIHARDTKDELKKAFRKAALKYHPDKPQGSTKAFQRVNLAYKTLNDPLARERYDNGNGNQLDWDDVRVLTSAVFKYSANSTPTWELQLTQ